MFCFLARKTLASLIANHSIRRKTRSSRSRYLLACTALPQITTAHVQPILTGLFRRHGLPRALRTDNGSPFANRTGLGGLVQLSVWLLKLNIWPDRIAPGRPDQNGRHERMHRTLGERARE
jgi:putative transposase